jgi:hypothetical protein
MIHRYAEWCRRRAGTAQCSPALWAAGMFLACCVVAYVYREVILKTVEVMAVAIAGTVMLAGFTALVVSSVRYYRRQVRFLAEADAIEAEPVPDTWTSPVVIPDITSMKDEEAITTEADWLASGVELAFSPDGQTLKAIKAKDK